MSEHNSRAATRVTLRGVTVVNTRDGSLTHSVNVVLDGDRIATITAAHDDQGHEPGTVIDAAGTFVVPGFLDMHTHTLEDTDPAGALALMLTNGITGFRQMSGSDRLLRQRQLQALPIPAAAPAVLAMPGAVLTPINAGTAQAAAATVAAQHAAGADFIKVALIGPAPFFAAQAEARRLGIPIVGHLPTGIDVLAASKGGMKSIEHLGPGVGILAATSTDQPGVQQILATRRPVKLPPAHLPFIDKIMAAIIKKIVLNPLARADTADVAALQRAESTFSEDRVRDLAAHFVADGTWQCPTLIRVRTQQFADAPEYSADPNLRYMAKATIKRWRAVTRTFTKLPTATRETFRANYALQLRLIKLFDDAGVKMIAGSDADGAAWEIPGFALHQEFDELAAAGLTPLRVLQMTTLNPAEFLGTTATMGTVEVGKNADLVLLNADPTKDIAHLHDIFAVVRAGHYHSRSDLDQMRQTVTQARSAR